MHVINASTNEIVLGPISSHMSQYSKIVTGGTICQEDIR